MKQTAKKEKEALLTFLRKTREGQYAKIDKNALSLSRVKEQREADYSEEEYFYSIS